MRVCTFALCGGLLAPLFGTSAVARQIQVNEFSSRVRTERFEGLNRPHSGNAIQNLPTPFTFPSGVSMIQPAPNRDDTFGPFVVDGGGFFGYSAEDLAPYIPSGTAYIGQSNAGLFDDGITFAFPEPMFRVGLFIVADPFHDGLSGPIHISISDASGRFLESMQASNILKENWKTNFVGFENAAGIGQIRIKGDGGDVLRLDNLMFEFPEPSGVSLVLCGACLILQRRRPSAVG